MQPDPSQGRLFDEPAEAPVARAPRQGKRRLSTADRHQISWAMLSVDQVLAEGHPVRAVWEWVARLDIDELLAEIQSVAGSAGRPAADPRILLALWLYAFLRGVGSARELDRLCREHVAYQWLCGGMKTNYHTLADFRMAHEAYLDELLTHSAAVLMRQGLVTLKRVAQDGMRTWGHVAADSFRRQQTLEEALAEAEAQLAALKEEAERDPGACSRRQQAARERAARERKERLEAALAELPEIAARKKKAQPKPGETAEEFDKRTAPRASTSDPEARVMKQGDGGFRPGYNINYVTDCDSRVILGVLVTNVGSDHGLIAPMVEQLEARYGQLPVAWLVDAGFDKHEDTELLERCGIAVYMPPQKQRKRGADPYTPLPGESEELASWRERMGTEEAKEIYRERASVAEYVNAQARNRGLRQLPVRGGPKVRRIAVWHALAHNLSRAIRLGAPW